MILDHNIVYYTVWRTVYSAPKTDNECNDLLNTDLFQGQHCSAAQYMVQILYHTAVSTVLYSVIKFHSFMIWPYDDLEAAATVLY